MAPQATAAPTSPSKRVVLVAVPPDGRFGYAELGWVIVTPADCADSTLLMPVAVSPPVLRIRSSRPKVSPGSR